MKPSTLKCDGVAQPLPKPKSHVILSHILQEESADAVGALASSALATMSRFCPRIVGSEGGFRVARPYLEIRGYEV